MSLLGYAFHSTIPHHLAERRIVEAIEMGRGEPLPRKLHQQPEYRRRMGRVEMARGLVEQQDLRFLREGSGYRDQLQLSGRELLHVAVGQMIRTRELDGTPGGCEIRRATCGTSNPTQPMMPAGATRGSTMSVVPQVVPIAPRTSKYFSMPSPEANSAETAMPEITMRITQPPKRTRTATP